MITKAFYRYLCCTVALCCGTAMALPPLGLTEIGSIGPQRFDLPVGRLEIIDDFAFISSPGGIQTVAPDGNSGFIPIDHPSIGMPASITRAIKGTDGEVYVAANFKTNF